MKNKPYDTLYLGTPGKARQALYENSRTAAVHLFCKHCQGGAYAGTCEVVACPLYSFRATGVDRDRPEGSVPSLVELAKGGEK